MSDPNGITAYPLAGYSTFTLSMKGSLVLEMRLIGRHPALGEAEQSLHFQMSAEQARALAESLLAAATASEMGNSPSNSRN